MNSIVLFGSGVTMHHALENWKHGKKSAFNTFMGATVLLGIMFLCGQAYEYSHAAIGGWSGSDPPPTLAQFKAWVAAGDVHYFIGGGGTGGPGGGSSGTGSAITSWVEANFSLRF